MVSHLRTLDTEITYDKVTITDGVETTAPATQKAKLFKTEYKDTEKKLIARSDITTIPVLPEPGAQIMPADKNEYISRIAIQLGCEIERWRDPSKRESAALWKAIKHSGYYCPTNPQTAEELIKTLEQVLFEKRITAENPLFSQFFKNNDIFTSSQPDRTIKIQSNRNILAGLAGLGSASLEVAETLSPDSNLSEVRIVNQASAGSTVASSAVITTLLSNPELISDENKSLLQKYFPKAYTRFVQSQLGYTSTVVAAVDPANSKALSDILDGLADKPKADSALQTVNPTPNGLGSYSSSDLSIRSLTMASRANNPTVTLAESTQKSPRVLMEVSRFLLFLDSIEKENANARFPESAAAAGLAAVLYEKINNGIINMYNVALWLKEYGVTQSMLKELADQRYMSLEDNVVFNTVTNTRRNLASELLAAISLPIDELKQKRISATKKSIDSSKVLVLYNTGSNTGSIKHKEHIPTLQIALEQKKAAEASTREEARKLAELENAAKKASDAYSKDNGNQALLIESLQTKLALEEFTRAMAERAMAEARHKTEELQRQLLDARRSPTRLPDSPSSDSDNTLSDGSAPTTPDSDRRSRSIENLNITNTEVRRKTSFSERAPQRDTYTSTLSSGRGSPSSILSSSPTDTNSPLSSSAKSLGRF